MARILITGMSGTGKMTVLEALRQRGHFVVDTDDPDWLLPDGGWDENRFDELLQDHRDLFVSGAVETHSKFHEMFDDVVLLSEPLEVVLGKARSQPNNPDATREHQQAEIKTYIYTVEPLLRSAATVELDGRGPADDLADLLERLAEDGFLPD